MADFFTTMIGQSITGTSGNDNMTFGIQLINGVPFVATGSLSGAGGDDSFFTLNATGPGGPLFNGIQTAYGNEGNDSITLEGLFTAYGGKGDDRIQDVGAGASQQFFGGEGNDTIVAADGNDYIEGNEGKDDINAGDGNDFIWGGKDNDAILGGTGFDTIYGNLGDDVIGGGDAADSIHGGQGNDTISGDNGNDSILGGAGKDLISGGAENDTILGGVDNDTIAGDAGDDSIVGGAGADVLTGGLGKDIFRYQDGPTANVGVTNVDIITDLLLVDDKISFATGADAVLAGLNFTTTTTANITNLGAIAGSTATYDSVFAAFAAAVPAPIASTDALLQVYTGTVAGTNFLFINGKDTVVTSATDILIQGVAAGQIAGGAAGNIVFS